MMSARAMTTLGVPLPTVIKKSGISRPFASVRFKSHAMTTLTIMPKVAARKAYVMLFLNEFKIDLREKMIFQ